MLPYVRNISTFCCRFIGDIFFVWYGTESELIEFIGNRHKKERAMFVDRKVLLQTKEKPATQRNLPLVFTFNVTKCQKYY